MTFFLLFISSVLLMSVLMSKLTNRIGIPVLLGFLALGMLFGSDGLFRIPFENFDFANHIATVALIFIIFYGGFGTNWKAAKPVAVQSVLLSTLGVLLTALLTGVFCRFVLRFDWLESLLIGAVLGSTDAASVFSILRSKNLSLKYNTASMLELESGDTLILSAMAYQDDRHIHCAKLPWQDTRNGRKSISPKLTGMALW